MAGGCRQGADDGEGGEAELLQDVARYRRCEGPHQRVERGRHPEYKPLLFLETNVVSRLSETVATRLIPKEMNGMITTIIHSRWKKKKSANATEKNTIPMRRSVCSANLFRNQITPKPLLNMMHTPVIICINWPVC